MAGHNKWSKVKNKKAVTDAKKSRLFSKMAKLIAAESKKAGGDTHSPALRAAIEKAKSANMPGDNIERAVQKGKTDTSAALEEVLYETYGPGGAAILVTGLTDNRNRTGAEVKHILSKNGHTLANPGSAQWAFQKTDDGWTPETTVSLSDTDAEKLATLVDALEEQEDVQEVFVNAE